MLSVLRDDPSPVLSELVSAGARPPDRQRHSAGGLRGF
ncbi:hypothetical protein RSKD131_4478 (plasmid) [Cereibacter sphaeroides KD131]|nr:hypothetical protein RSKD131_4478 [Cereibacter sphaeroides KD131]